MIISGYPTQVTYLLDFSSEHNVLFISLKKLLKF